MGAVGNCWADSSVRPANLLLVLGLELFQELYQSLGAFDGHGIIDACAEAAHGLVALEIIVPCGLGGGDHLGVQLGGLGDEG